MAIIAREPNDAIAEAIEKTRQPTDKVEITNTTELRNGLKNYTVELSPAHEYESIKDKEEKAPPSKDGSVQIS